MYIKVDYKEKPCRFCDQLFKPNRKDKKYCSRNCAQKATRHRQEWYKEAKNSRSKPYRKFKKDRCEACGFLALDSCQLDVHHLDHNHKNNEESNLKTLCANCHRLHHFGPKTMDPLGSNP